MGASFGQGQLRIVPAVFKSQIFDICLPSGVCSHSVHVESKAVETGKAEHFCSEEDHFHNISQVKINHTCNQIQEREKQTVPLDERGYKVILKNVRLGSKKICDHICDQFYVTTDIIYPIL